MVYERNIAKTLKKSNKTQTNKNKQHEHNKNSQPA